MADLSFELGSVFLAAWEQVVKPGLVKLGNWGWQQKEWWAAGRRYADKIAQDYGTIRILGMAQPVPLPTIYTDVLILDKPIAYGRFSVEALEAEFTQRGRRWWGDSSDKRHTGTDLVANVNKLYLLGKPGAGKTTFLKYLALKASRGELRFPRKGQAGSEPKVPIFVTLRDWADKGGMLATYLARELEICGFPEAGGYLEALLKSGRALVLFDGLDEVTAAQDAKQKITAQIRDFARQYSDCHVVVTCRIAAKDYSFDQFTYMELADFTPQQVKAFVGHWFRPNDKKRDSMLAELARPEHEGIRELTNNPLLLTLLCLTYEETLHFPPHRVEIYEEALDALLKKWDSSRGIQRDEAYRNLSLGRKKKMLGRIAFAAFDRGRYFWPQDELARQLVDYLQKVPEAPAAVDIDGEAVLRAIAAQHGLLVERARGVYSFSHLTFQEYFTAQQIVENQGRGSLDRLVGHSHEDRWREVFLLVASRLDEADAFLGVWLRHLERLAAGDPTLIELLNWAALSRRGEPGAAPPALRAWYVWLARVLDLALARDRALDLARDLALDLARARALDRDRARDRARALGLGLALGLDLALARALALDFDLDLAFDYLMVMGEQYMILFGQLITKFKRTQKEALAQALQETQEQLIDWAQALRLPALRDALRSLVAPSASADEKAWQAFQARWRAIALEQRDLRAWQFTPAQEAILEAYLAGTQLLVACLKVAYVNDRAAIEAGILAPPGGGE